MSNRRCFTPLVSTLALALLLVGGGTLVAAGQQAATTAPKPPPEPRNGITPAYLTQLFDAYELLEAQEALRLSDEQYEEFVIRLKDLQTVRRQHQGTRLRLITELRKLTNPNAPPNEAAVKERFEALQKQEETGPVAIKRAHDRIDEILDVYQRARFRVFEEQLERRKFDLLSRVRGARQRSQQNLSRMR